MFCFINDFLFLVDFIPYKVRVEEKLEFTFYLLSSLIIKLQ